MSKKNTITFNLLYKVNFGQIICIQFKNCPQFQNLPQVMYPSQQKHDHMHSITLIFSDSSLYSKNDTISYTYYVGDYENPSLKIHDVIDQITQQPIELTFQRQDYLNSYLQIFDRCDWRLNQEERIKRNIQGRIKSQLKLDKILNYNVKFITDVLPQARRYYLFQPSDLLKFDPQQLDSYQYNEQKQKQNEDKSQNKYQDKNQDKFQKQNNKEEQNKDENNNRKKIIYKQQMNNLFRAKKMQMHLLPNNKQLHIYRIITTIANQKQKKTNGLKVFAIYQSYQYNRIKKTWKISPNPALPKGLPKQINNIQDLTKLLDQKEFKYQINVNNQQNPQTNKIITNGKQNDFPIQTQFVYQVAEGDVDTQKILSVYVVIKDKGKFRMDHQQDNKNMWYTKIGLYKKQKAGMKYYFQINVVDQFNQCQDQKRCSWNTNPEILICNSNNIRIKSKAQAKNKGIYYPGYWSTTQYPPIYYQSLPQPHPTTQLITTQIHHPQHFPNSNNSTPTPSPPCTPSKQQIIHHINNITQRPRGFYPSIINHTNIYESPQEILKFIYINNIYEDITGEYEQPVKEYVNHIKNIYSIYNYANDFKNKLKKAKRFTINNLSQYRDQIIKTNFYEEYSNPIKIQLIQQTINEKIQDKFTKFITGVTKRKDQLCGLMKQIHQLHTKQDKNINTITEDNVQILFAKIICAAKLWGQTYTDKNNRIINILMQGNSYLNQNHPINEQVKTRISNIMFYLNDHCHKERYTYKVQHKFCDPPVSNCQNYIQQRVIEHINSIRNERQRNKEFIQNDKLFKVLVMIVDSNINQFVEFGNRHEIYMRTSEISQNLMRLLMNYSIIYSLGTYLDQNFPIFSNRGCLQFNPFCLQPTETQFYSHHLNNIRDKYLKEIRQTKSLLKTDQQKVVDLQRQFCQILQTQSSNNKKATHIFAIHTDIQQLQKYMLQNDKTQFFCDIDLNQSFSRECKQIDEEKDQDKKFVKVTNWLNHDYIKNYTSAV